MALQRRLVTFQGNVQGVGFRYTACRLAEAFDVKGYVRNTPDGSVEVVIEGDLAEIDRFLGSLRDQMAPYIHKEGQQTSAHRNEFRSFGVKY